MVLSGPAPAAASGVETPDQAARLRRLVGEHISFVWRSLRRFGVSEADADDASQEVFLVTSRRLDEIPEDKERAFLYSTAARVAANSRRSRKRREAAYERYETAPMEAQATPETMTDQLRARSLLNGILETMPEELREVLVLFEIEELGIAEIAEALDIPMGTVGSRLRRGRERFKAALLRHEARQDFQARVMP
jgi:RNA polymerase sigma-70 factor (ECF subfamily)